jgi:hypothetical protein
MSKASEIIESLSTIQERSIYDDVEQIGGTVRIYADGGLNTSMWSELKGDELKLADKLLSKFRKNKERYKPGCPENKLGVPFKPKGGNREYYATNVSNNGVMLWLVAYDNRAEQGGYAWYVNFYREK